MSFIVAFKGMHSEKYLFCMTATALGPLNHVRQSEFSGIDLFALVCVEKQTEEKTKWAFSWRFHHLPPCETVEGQHPVLCCWYNVRKTVVQNRQK